MHYVKEPTQKKKPSRNRLYYYIFFIKYFNFINFSKLQWLSLSQFQNCFTLKFTFKTLNKEQTFKSKLYFVIIWINVLDNSLENSTVSLYRKIQYKWVYVTVLSSWLKKIKNSQLMILVLCKKCHCMFQSRSFKPHD